MVIAGKAKSKSKKKRRALCIGRAFKGGTGNNKKGKKARRIAPANVRHVRGVRQRVRERVDGDLGGGSACRGWACESVARACDWMMCGAA